MQGIGEGEVAGLVRQAWDDLLAAARETGFDVDRLVRPPATRAQIAAAEAAVGRRLPEDLAELYLLSDGQFFFRHADTSDLGRGRWVGPLLGSGWEFDSLERLVTEYQVWVDVRAPLTPEELAQDFDDCVFVPTGHPVKCVYTHEAWVPFATDGGGNSLAVDLAPEPGGDRGQVIVIGSDEDRRRVVAPSVLDLLRLCADRLRRPVGELYVEDGVALYELEDREQEEAEAPRL